MACQPSQKVSRVWRHFFARDELPARDDLSLCFLCLRWTTDDPACRKGIRCELQLALDRLEAHT